MYPRRGFGAEPPAHGGFGAKPLAAGRFFVIFWKKNYFQCHWITFCTCSEPFERTRFLTYESQLKDSIVLLLTI